MALTVLEVQLVKNTVGDLCHRKTNPALKDKLRFDYKIHNQNVILLEIRPGWRNPKEFMEQEFAKFQFIRTKRVWKLYWMRASGKWENYEPAPFSEDLGELVDVVDEDSYCCFFG
ncbi:DUF3024 domain-containing protein [candidate division KSB1 bacterium]|nr:DUF3024 domain-containing protein [candidate division KSB1 bacterium]